MKKTLINLIHASSDDEKKLTAINGIFTLYEQLQYASSIDQLASDTYDWLNKEFNVDNVIFSLFNLDNNTKENIFQRGEEFFLDDTLSFFFIINTHTNQNAIISFSATSKVHYEVIQQSYETIESAFFLISPIVQSKILKRNFIQSQSIDSVTNVYNRQYLTEHINKQLSVSKNEASKIFFLMVGIDRFKAVIEEFDYDIADQVLVNLAKTIHTNINEFDTVARLTGDEFLIAVQSTTDISEISLIANKIIEDFANTKVTVNDNGQTLQKTISIGFDSLEINSESSSIDNTIKNADIALNEAKNLGRSRYMNFSDVNQGAIDFF